VERARHVAATWKQAEDQHRRQALQEVQNHLDQAEQRRSGFLSAKANKAAATNAKVCDVQDAMAAQQTQMQEAQQQKAARADELRLNRLAAKANKAAATNAKVGNAQDAMAAQRTQMQESLVNQQQKAASLRACNLQTKRQRSVDHSKKVEIMCHQAQAARVLQKWWRSL
jgi:hypothetical protein